MYITQYVIYSMNMRNDMTNNDTNVSVAVRFKDYILHWKSVKHSLVFKLLTFCVKSSRLHLFAVRCELVLFMHHITIDKVWEQEEKDGDFAKWEYFDFKIKQNSRKQNSFHEIILFLENKWTWNRHSNTSLTPAWLIVIIKLFNKGIMINIHGIVDKLFWRAMIRDSQLLTFNDISYLIINIICLWSRRVNFGQLMHFTYIDSH